MTRRHAAAEGEGVAVPAAPEALKAQFPAFGGKRRVASLVWDRLGDVANFIEPFANSAAVLLARPHPPRIETLNDQNCYIANYWRAVKTDPGAVAEHADWPVNEADLHSRHRWLVLSEAAADFRQRMRTDPDYFDAKVAGWWVWGSCCWIGSGWCATPESARRNQAPGAAYSGVHAISAPVAKRPNIGGDDMGGLTYGRGVRAKGPSEKIPRLNGARKGDEYYGGLGVHLDKIAGPSDAHRPQLADSFSRGRGVHGHDEASTCEARRSWLTEWTRRLSDRLRTVRVCCGDWERVCGSPSVTTRLGVTGIFLDPPYPTRAPDGTESRAAGLYGANDSGDELDRLRDRVLAYCRERGGDPQMRICVAAYDSDGYDALLELGWDVVAWKASGGYGNRSEKGKANAGRERLYFSPACARPVSRRGDLPGQGLLFEAPEETS